MKTHTQSPILSALQSIHDDAAHALGTEAEPQERLSVARQDLEVIRETARDAIEGCEAREKTFAALLGNCEEASQCLAFDPETPIEDLRANIEQARALLCAAIALAEGRAQ